MGGSTPKIYVRPIPDYPADKWRSTYWAHTRRNPPSREPGVDYYCPLGTVLVSLGDGVVTEVGGSIYPATGRYVRVNLDNGQGFRLLHLGPGHSLKRVGQRVRRGEPLAISGASGYGSEYFGAKSPYDAQMILNTGGPHTHLSLFPRWGSAYADTIDPEPWMMDPTTAGGGLSPLEPKEWDEMATEQQIDQIVSEAKGDYVITHASTDADNGIYRASSGFWRKIGGPANDIMNTYQDGENHLTIAQRSIPINTNGNIAVLIRFHELFAPAGVRLDGTLEGTDDTETILARIDAAIDTLPNKSEIAAAVRDEFAARPLG